MLYREVVCNVGDFVKHVFLLSVRDTHNGTKRNKEGKWTFPDHENQALRLFEFKHII